MMSTVLAISRPTPPTLAEFAYALLTLAHRPDVAAFGAPLEDTNGHPLDTLILIEERDGDGARSLSVRLAGPDDHLSQAQIGDTL